MEIILRANNKHYELPVRGALGLVCLASNVIISLRGEEAGCCADFAVCFVLFMLAWFCGNT